MMRIFLSVLLGTILLAACGMFGNINIKSPEIVLTERIDSTSITVLPFTKQGQFLPSYTGALFSDKLSDRLFLSGKYFVTSKPNLKDAFREFEVKSAAKLSNKKIKAIGTYLNSKYIIQGKILQYSDSEFTDINSKRKLNIRGNILSVETGEIVGVINVLGEYENVNIIEVFDSITEEIVSGLNK